MEIEGRLQETLPPQDIPLRTGGTIQKEGFVINRNGKPLYFEVMGREAVQRLDSIDLGSRLRVRFYIESQAHSGKYYTTLRCTDIADLTRRNILSH